MLAFGLAGWLAAWELWSGPVGVLDADSGCTDVAGDEEAGDCMCVLPGKLSAAGSGVEAVGAVCDCDLGDVVTGVDCTDDGGESGMAGSV